VLKHDARRGKSASSLPKELILYMNALICILQRGKFNDILVNGSVTPNAIGAGKSPPSFKGLKAV